MQNKAPGLFTRIKAAAQYVFQASGEYSGAYTGYFGTSFTWGAFSYAKDGYIGNDAVYAAARVYLKKIRMAPLIVTRENNKKEYRRYKGLIQSSDSQHRIKAMQHRVKALEELENHPLIDLFDKPNNYQTQSEFIEAIAGYMKIDTGAFIYKEAPGEDSINNGRPTSLHVIPNEWMQVKVSGDFKNPILGYILTFNGIQYQIEPSEMIYIKDWNPVNRNIGVSPLEPGSKIVQADGYGKKAMARAFEHGGSATLLSDGGTDAAGNRMTAEQWDLLQEKIQSNYQGRFGQLTATTAAVNVQKIGDSPTDLKLIEAAKFNRGVIASVLGVDGILIGDKDGGTENNVQAAYKALVSNTILPDLLHIQECLYEWLAPYYENGIGFEFDTDVYPELQPDLKLMSEVFGQVQITVDENRKLYKFDELGGEEGTAILIPSGMDTLKNIVSPSVTDNEFDQALKRLGGHGDYK